MTGGTIWPLPSVVSLAFLADGSDFEAALIEALSSLLNTLISFSGKGQPALALPVGSAPDRPSGTVMPPVETPETTTTALITPASALGGKPRRLRSDELSLASGSVSVSSLSGSASLSGWSSDQDRTPTPDPHAGLTASSAVRMCPPTQSGLEFPSASVLGHRLCPSIPQSSTSGAPTYSAPASATGAVLGSAP